MPFPVSLMTEAGQIQAHFPGLGEFELGAGPPAPADGIVSLVAYVRGEEEFQDNDGNNEYDDRFDTLRLGDDRPEPFVDADDDGIRDPDEPALECGEGCSTAAPLRPDCPDADLHLAPGGTVTVRSRFADARGNCLGRDPAGFVSLRTSSPEVRSPQPVAPLGACFDALGQPAAGEVAQTLVDQGLGEARPPELFEVTVTASAPGPDGLPHELGRTFTACR